MNTISLKQSYDAEFCKLMNKLFKEYPEGLFYLEGIHPDQLDINKVSRDYFKTSDRKGSATADHSIDPNANVSGRDVITYNYEVPKSLMKLNSLYNLWKVIKEQSGYDVAEMAIIGEITGKIYINDCWDIGRPYCFNFSTYDIALEGLKMGGRLKIDPPKSLNSFLRQVEQFVVYAANSTLGATGLADFLIVTSWYVDKMLETGMDHHVYVGDPDDVMTYVKESLTSLLYTLNWEFRGNQSPFTNVSVYDTFFLSKLLPSYMIEDRCPTLLTVKLIQNLFLDCYNETLSRTPITFPVMTACFSVENDEHTGKRKIRDEKFLNMIAEKNLKYGFINLYCGETSTLSSCCRLRSSISDLGYSNTFGAGSTKIGSLGVVTLNLPSMAREAVKSTPRGDTARLISTFLLCVRAGASLAGRINNAKRAFLQDRIDRGSLPLYTLGFMDLKRQYSTCGFTGLSEAIDILGCATDSFSTIKDPEGFSVAQNALKEINKTNEDCTSLFGFPHNMEQVPAESSAAKLAKKDTILGENPEGYELYSNQFIPLWDNSDIIDRIKMQGALDQYCTGGAICHLNIASSITNVHIMKDLIKFAAESGVVYFAVNYEINKCKNDHMTVGHNVDKCPICGEEITDTFTRVVGFLTNTKHWNRVRREVDWPNRVFAEQKY